MFNEVPPNWKEDPNVIEGIKGIVGADNFLDTRIDPNDCHPIIWLDFKEDFILSDEMKAEYAALLDGMGWQIVNDIGIAKENEQVVEINMIGAAPRLRANVGGLLYHVTKKENWPSIQKNGLLPSNEERTLTHYNDTAGKIHFSRSCGRRDAKPGAGALHWLEKFEGAYAPHEFVILKVDVSGMTNNMRKYLDTHVENVIVVDTIESIKSWRIALVKVKRC